jgi:2',3'-cyclic-nucleotide 2'-phosphodiesterase (5'-nucleotidase family)
MRKRVSVLGVRLAGLLMTLAPASFAAGPRKDKDTQVQLLAINDFHGNLQPPSGSSGRISTGPMATVDAGGIEYLATWIKKLRERNSNTITVGAGDLIGASPLISGLFHDEPTIEEMNALGLDVSGVGTTTSTRASTSCCGCYRVAMNNFLASGGDGFSVFNEGTDQVGGEIDINALVAYF